MSAGARWRPNSIDGCRWLRQSRLARRGRDDALLAQMVFRSLWAYDSHPPRGPIMRSASCLIILFAVTSFSTSLYAGEPPPPEAVKHSQACLRAYDLAEYARAIAECKAAYEIYPASLLLFSLGQAHRKLGQLPLAVVFYKKYLAKAPSGSRLQDAQEQIAQLEPLILATEKSKAAPPDSATPVGPDGPASKAAQPRPPSLPSIDQNHWYTRPMAIAGFVTLPLGVAVAGTGGGLLGKSASLRADASRTMLLAEQMQLGQSADTYQAAGYALLGVGVAIAITGAVLIGVSSRRRGAVLSLSPSVNGGHFVVGGSL